MGVLGIILLPIAVVVIVLGISCWLWYQKVQIR